MAKRVPGFRSSLVRALGVSAATTAVTLGVSVPSAFAAEVVVNQLTGPHMTLTKTANPTFGAAPASVTYTYTLTNDGTDTLFHVGVTDNQCAPVTLQSGDMNGDQLLQPGEVWTYTCSTTFPTPNTYVNTAQATGRNTQTGLTVTSNTASATVVVSDGFAGGHMTLSKHANPTSGQAPLPVTYTFTVVNDGANPLTGMTLADSQCNPVYQAGDFNNDNILGPGGETWTYTCTLTHPSPGTYTNNATATATDAQTGQPVTSNTATATVTATGPAPVTNPGPHITLTKTPNPTSGAAPLNVTYTYTLVNDGTDTLFHVGVTDDACTPVTYQSGDVNNDQLLDSGETWTFTCSTTLTTAGAHTNTAQGAGTNTQTGLPVTSNTAQTTVNVGGDGGPPPTSGPHITLSKSPSIPIATLGRPVTYTYTLVNDGSDTLFHVSVTDDRCSPVTRTAGDVNNDQLLDAGETWTFTCTRSVTRFGDNINTAQASGTNTQTGLAVTSNTAEANVIVPIG